MDSTTPNQSSPVSTWAYLPVWIAVWSSLILLDVAKDIFQVQIYPRAGRDLTWMVQEWAAFWGLWVVVSLAIPPLVRRFNPDRLGWRRTLGAHAIASVVLMAVQLGLAAMAFQVMDRDGQTYFDRLSGYFFSFSIRSLLIYWTLLGALLSWNYWLRTRAKEVEAARLQARAAQLELLVSETRLATLRRDLNPHFLFNALNGLSGLVREGRTDTAVEMIAGLGRLLRLSLDENPSGMIELRDEANNIREYLYIEELRVGDRLTVDWELGPETLQLAVPSFVLQPLVENAIHHGAGASAGRVTIAIRSWLEGGTLVLEVEDSGPGLRPSVEGTGLSNTRARLDLHYGEEASLNLTSGDEGGTLARLRLPVPELTPATGVSA